MTLDEIERAISLAKARGLAELECAIGQGGRLKVIVHRPQKPVPVVVTATKGTQRRPAIRTDYFGVFADVRPAVKEGDHVAEHQIVGFLELGDIRFAIKAGKTGRIAARHVQPGDLVGYGETVFDYD
jgi:biotin carboxyl carrier protein